MRLRLTVAAILLTLVAAAIWGPKYFNTHVRGNFREVVPGVVYRSSQPTAAQLARWQKRYGLKTVINLRGTDTSEYAEERSATDRLGLRQIDIAWPQNRLLTLADVRTLQAAVAGSPGPYLVHCGAGVNRSAAVAVLMAMAVGHQDYRVARVQLKSVHWGLHDADAWARGRFAEYEDYCRQNGLDTDGWTQFYQWLEKSER